MRSSEGRRETLGAHSLTDRSIEFLRASYRAARVSSVLCFTSATVAGAAVARSFIDFRTVGLLLFSAFSVAFAFVANDLADAELDRSACVLRNPVSTGEMSLRGCTSLALFLLFVSVTALFSLSSHNHLLGLIVIFLFFTYSWVVRAKARPFLDIAYHGTCLAIFAAIGYMEYRSFDVTCLLLASLVFLLSAVSQILQEVRDHETDRNKIETTVTLVGKKISLILCLAFLAFAFVVFSILLFCGAISPSILLLSPLAYFVVAPMVRAVRNEEETRMLGDFREKRLILITISIATLILSTSIF